VAFRLSYHEQYLATVIRRFAGYRFDHNVAAFKETRKQEKVPNGNRRESGRLLYTMVNIPPYTSNKAEGICPYAYQQANVCTSNVSVFCSLPDGKKDLAHLRRKSKHKLKIHAEFPLVRLLESSSAKSFLKLGYIQPRPQDEEIR